MPKFMTYQRPAPVNKSNWNASLGRKAQMPAKLPVADKSAAQPAGLPPLDQLLSKP